jgi:hypothetical protein
VRKVILVAALALLVPGAAAAKKPAPPPVAGTWAAGVEISYTETVRDAAGNIVSQTHRDGLQPGVLFAGPGGGASLAGSSLADATSIDAGSDLAAAAQRPAPRRLAGCCSSQGSDTVSFSVTKWSISGLFVAWRYQQVVRWCWQYPNITCFDARGDFTNVDANGQVRYENNGYGWYYTWAGGPFGGHYSHREGRVDNCIIKYGCIGSYYPWVDIYVNGNGAWSGSGGGT